VWWAAPRARWSRPGAPAGARVHQRPGAGLPAGGPSAGAQAARGRCSRATPTWSSWWARRSTSGSRSGRFGEATVVHVVDSAEGRRPRTSTC
jgi:hypothetical protein